MTSKELRISPLNHTWILDFDGTLVRHNGYKDGITNSDEWLPGALDFLHSIPVDDYVLILTAREDEEDVRSRTIEFIRAANVRFNDIKFGMPMGERILINDNKPSGLVCSHAVTPERNQGLEELKITIDENL